MCTGTGSLVWSCMCISGMICPQGLDVVPTDIASGLILVQIEQDKQPKRLCLDPLTYMPYLDMGPSASESMDGVASSEPSASGSPAGLDSTEISGITSLKGR